MPTVILWGLLCVSACIGLWLAGMGAHGVWKVFRMRKCLPWRTAIVRQVEGEDTALLRLEGETEKVRCQLPHADRMLSRSLQVAWCKRDGVLLTKKEALQSAAMLGMGLLLVWWAVVLMLFL